ncbi:MAG: protease inhibitor I42 family protein [Chloroflexi bacterium]|nr:protease inhibitor I42 family protein [Chloroflexota bacterium]
MKRILRLLIFPLFLGLLAGCGPKDSNLTEANDGHPATIHVGGKVVVTLQANPTTGYTWDVGEVDTNILKQVGQTEYNSSSSTPMPGQGGTQTLRFQAVAPGTTTLKLIYHRPFEKNTPPIQTYTVQVTVVP